MRPGKARVKLAFRGPVAVMFCIFLTDAKTHILWVHFLFYHLLLPTGSHSFNLLFNYYILLYFSIAHNPFMFQPCFDSS